MADVELLPCPWCGEKLTTASVSEGSTFHWRKVDGCCTDGPEVRHNTMADDQKAAEEDSRLRAIAAWNTRANMEPLRAENERLRADNAVLSAEYYRVVHALLDEHCRAERLAEALRKARPFVAYAYDQGIVG